MLKCDLMLVTGGQIIRGFDQVSVQYSMDSLFGEFDLTIKSRWIDKKDLPIKAGSPCVLFLSNRQILTGFIDYINFSFGSEGSSIEVYGRSKSVDVAESCLDLKSNQFRGKQTVMSVTEKLLEPFGVFLEADQEVQTKELKDWKLEPGERVGDALIRIAQSLRLQIHGLANGGLFLGKPFTGKTAGWVRVGDNLEKIQSAFDYTDLFSRYIVRGEEKEGNTGKTKAVRGEEKQAGIRKARTLVVPYDALTDKKKAGGLAEWERQVRHGKAYQVSSVVSGWMNPETGMPWEINTLVAVDCIKASVKKDLLIFGVSFDYNDEQGHTTTLELKHPDSFSSVPVEIKPESKEDHLKKNSHLIYG